MKLILPTLSSPRSMITLSSFYGLGVLSRRCLTTMVLIRLVNHSRTDTFIPPTPRKPRYFTDLITSTAPRSRPYHVTSILVDGVAQSLQDLSIRVGHVSSQVDHVISRTSAVETKLYELGVFLEKVVFPALRDSARALGPLIAESPTLERKFAAPAARLTNPMAEIRQVVDSIRVQQQGKSAFVTCSVSLH